MASEIGRRPAPSYALIIGIDDYAHFPKLRGAVADAKAMEQHFEEVLHMPSDRIRTLYNEEATRKAIMEAFEYLRGDAFEIDKGDPIVIFYAGHGGERSAPQAWHVKEKIQCLIPQDCRAEQMQEGVKLVTDHAPIPDRSIGVILEDVAKKKGDNVTVILDCCHSASGTRGKEYIPFRGVDLNHVPISDDLDGHIWRGRVGTLHNGFAYHGLRSHVLLAACREKEKAYENEGRGQFSHALLEVFRSCADNKLPVDFSYAEALERIHLNKDQHPQCEGLNRHRVLFGSRVPAGRQAWYKTDAGEGKYVMDAGLAHGVAPGIEFSLYDTERRWLGVIPVDAASTISDFETTISTPHHVLKDAKYAKVTRVGKVPIYIGNNPVLEETLKKMEGNAANAPKFTIVSKLDEAKLQITMEDDQRLVFKILDERVQRLGLTEFPHKTTFESLTHVLPAAAHFFWYLDLANEKSQLGRNREVSVDFFVLKKDYDDFGMPLLCPIEPGFRRQDPYSDDSDIIDFAVDPARAYGIAIKNNTKKDLYLNAFLFNNSSMSVALCYTQMSAGETEAPLKQGETFTVGYGPAGTPPFSYSLEVGQDIDVGLLKLFLSTRYIDLSDIEQPSPFSSVHPPPSRDRREGDPPRNLRLSRNIWFTTMIPVVQRRKA